ncbi:glycosyltransferase family 4 protein [soil metagenome]
MSAIRSSAVDARPPLRVLRLCTGFMPPARVLEQGGSGFDPIGGMQNHTAELARALDAHGIVQTIVTTRPPGAPRLQRLGGSVEVIRLGVPIRRCRQLYSVPASRLVPALGTRNDLIHVHLGEDLAVLPIAMRAATANRVPLVVTVHCSLLHTLRALDARTWTLKLLGGPIERRAERSADAVITLTPTLAQRLVCDGVAAERIYVIPSGVNPGLFGGDFPSPWPELAGPKIVFVGRLVLQKGVHTLLEAARHVGVPDAQLIFVGDGPERSSLERKARSLGLEDRVHITGFVPHDAIPAVLRHADVLVLPSIYEELGSILIEAMQARLPIVASRTGGIPDAITHEDNGLLVAPGDPNALAGALQRVLGDHLLAQRLGHSAGERARAYDWATLGNKVLDVYRDVLNRLPAGDHSRRGARSLQD